jgi:hypothetical protein
MANETCQAIAYGAPCAMTINDPTVTTTTVCPDARIP